MARPPHWLLAAAGYAALGIGFFWQPLFQPEYSIPRGGGDMAAQYYPHFRFAADSLQAGVFPWWNPYLNAGAPFAADVQTALYYPINWIAWALARPFTYEWLEALAMVHFPLAGFWTYLLARRLGIGAAGAFTAGVAFAFGGAMVARVGHPVALAAASWLPLVVLCLLRALQAADLRWAVGCGLVLAVALFAGHTQVALYLVLTLGLLWVWWLVAETRSSRGLFAGRRLRLAATFPVVGLVAAAVAAVQILPTAELLGLSVRADLTFARATEFAVPPLSLVHLVVPHFFGSSAADYWGITGSLTEGYGYVGISTLLLAVVGLLMQRSTPRMLWFFAALAVLGLLGSLGQETPLYGWLYRFVPGFDKVRAPGRLLLLFDFGVAMLAGYGVHALAGPLRRLDRPRIAALARIGIVLATASGCVLIPTLLFALLTSQGADPAIFERVRTALNSAVMSTLFLTATAVLLVARWRRAAAPLAGVAAIIVILDVFAANIGFNPGTGDILEGFEQPQVIAYLRSQPGPFRIDSFTDVGGLWQPNLPLIERVADASGSPINPLLLASYDRYWANLGSRSVPGYDLLNVRYVVGSKQVQLDWSKFQPALTDAPGVNLHRNQRELPRAIVVPVAIAADEATALARLRDPAWDPRAEVILSRGAERGERLGTPWAAGATARVDTVEHPDTNTTVVRGDSPGGFLLVNEVMYPGWTAVLNGRPVEIEYANAIMKAIALPAGPFEVTLAYQPGRWWLGLAISLLGLVGATVAIAFPWQRAATRPAR